jgi:diguanylate cyclase (GGDEF)-like protein
MNLYGLPEFLAYSMLLGIAYVLIRQGNEERLRYWLIGWVLIFLHAAMFMLFSESTPLDIIARSTLTLAGQAFILAAFHQEPTAVKSTQLNVRMLVSGTLNLIFAVTSRFVADIGASDQHLGVFYLLIAVGAASTIWLAEVARPESEARFRVSVALTVFVYAVQAWLLSVFGLTMAGQWLMCWTYLAVAYFFVGPRAKLTLGVAFTALSFVLWGLVFPAYSLLMIYAPEILGRIESETWNLPKFLAAASMILVLLEERVLSATHLASHDELTGLPNRRLYADRLEQAMARAARDRSGFGFLVIDLNKFKLVNDTLGHQAGDELLKVVSGRFRAVLRSVDTLARTGGDEFTVILDGVQNLSEASIVGEILQKSLAEPIVLRGGLYYAGASVGSAVYPDDGLTQTRLQSVADERMYASKERRPAGPTKRQLLTQSNDRRSQQGAVPT